MTREPCIMKDNPDPRTALFEAANAKGDSLAALSRMIGRRDSYLATFVREGHPKALTQANHASLCAYFGKPLGLRDLWLHV